MRRESAVALGVFSALTAGTAALGARVTNHGTQLWYRRLRKPPFQPPKATFRYVWPVLYGCIALSGWRVWNAPSGPARSRALGLWTLQLGLNAAWSWLFFGKRRLKSSLVDNLALGTSIAAYIAAARKVDRPAAALVAPYLGWVGFANLLNEELVRRNR
ncbi:TspO/MBR family protein [Hyalangium rubrum]|uniref:TspO/MBR family protein n=1 Tax=Hyalangium rubrum TaxID=3103134 RepID=A0ABU5GYG7_9BACT|nr:TspO/MBR family protein [Hyalangium sp. s54d21]MDY7225907.1 TspO/MBR family protein [Hyalangium sp. s54d21]